MRRLYGGVEVYSIKDLATATGQGYAKIWNRVNRGTLPRPSVAHQNLEYYSAEDFASLVAHLKAEAKEGE